MPRTDSPRPTPTAPLTPRRTQQERRDETRAKLLDATIESLVEVGYSATTTRLVAERAGVSSGAQSHHFPRRVDLVSAAIEELAKRRIAEFGERLTILPTDETKRSEVLLDLLWADFSSSLFTVFVKVWVAAADDPQLHDGLVPVERELARSIGEVVHEAAGDLVGAPSWEHRLRVVLNAIRGLALTESFEPRNRRGRDPWPELRAALLEMLAAASPVAGDC
jgi:AcrR family transcriptional regulator